MLTQAAKIMFSKRILQLKSLFGIKRPTGRFKYCLNIETLRMEEGKLESNEEGITWQYAGIVGYRR